MSPDYNKDSIHKRMNGGSLSGSQHMDGEEGLAREVQALHAQLQAEQDLVQALRRQLGQEGIGADTGMCRDTALILRTKRIGARLGGGG